MYTIALSRSARKELEKLTPAVAERVTVAIDRLANDPRPPGCVKLTGSEGWRIRVGDWRVVYTIEDVVLVVEVIAVRPRGSAYRA